jgi:hypothetical protein
MAIQLDIVTQKFLAEMINQHTNRMIAALLTDVEAHVGGHNPEISSIVKDTANASKRIMVKRITNLDVESRYG